MFFQLEEVVRATKAADQLQKAKEKLNSLVLNAYRPQHTVKKSLSETIDAIHRLAEKKMKSFQQIEEDALGGYLIPSFLDWQKLTDRTELPEWTQVVLEKQFEKQKKALDVMARKTYSAHALTEAKDKLTRQINSFRVLSDRYRVLAEHDQVIDIMNEAQKLKALTALTNQKYLSYCNIMASRLTAFAEEMVAKCCKFSEEVGSLAGKSNNAWMSVQKNKQISAPQKRQSVDKESWLTRANRTVDLTKYRHTQSRNNIFLLSQQPQWFKSVSDFYS